MNFNQLQKLAKKSGWTSGYAAPKHVAAIINNAIDAMSDLEQSMLKAECDARPMSDPVNFISGFLDLVGGKLVMVSSDGMQQVHKQMVTIERMGTPGVINLSGLTLREKTLVLQAMVAAS